jgi:hypothetical protein
MTKPRWLKAALPTCLIGQGRGTVFIPGTTIMHQSNPTEKSFPHLFLLCCCDKRPQRSTPKLFATKNVLQLFEKMGKEEQEEERQVLESIFPEEITGMIRPSLPAFPQQYPSTPPPSPRSRGMQIFRRPNSASL